MTGTTGAVKSAFADHSTDALITNSALQVCRGAGRRGRCPCPVGWLSRVVVGTAKVRNEGADGALLRTQPSANR